MAEVSGSNMGVIRNATSTNTVDQLVSIGRLLGAGFALCNVYESGGANRGVMVEKFLRAVHLPRGEPWCAAFIAYAGYQSQLDSMGRKSSWPLPMTGSCSILGEFGHRHGILQDSPEPGDVFLWHNPALRRFAHTGIVVNVLEGERTYTCVTIEGNTSDDGSREGTKSCIRVRAFAKDSGHRFLRWIALARAASDTNHASRKVA